ncbi:MAG: hypothetical protein FJW20_01640 [Acidimicrobiia bacterium]|nr:hypothetical protein [Acidimicrobiia bacterium]
MTYGEFFLQAGKRLRGAVREVRELEDGYALRLDGKALGLAEQGLMERSRLFMAGPRISAKRKGQVR